MKLAEDLKKAVLQAAMQGKLTKQLETDSSVDELLKKIAEEKEKLIAEGKIQKNKPWSNKVEFKEPLFEIPYNWKFVRFGEIMLSRDNERKPVSSHERMHKEKIYDYYGASGVIDKTDDYLFDKDLMLIGEDGANLLTRSTPIAFIARGKYWVNNHAHVLDVCAGLNLEYITLYINSISLAPYVTGTAQPKMNQENMNAIWIPLPPIEEQQRIVEKLNQILPLIDEYGKEEDELIALCQKFPEEMKKSVLQAAMQGKLTEQLETDSSVDELLKKIAEEKAKLIEEGKIKKDTTKAGASGRALAEITEEEIPFDIPENWRWIKLGNIGTFLRGSGIKRAETVSEGLPCIRYGELYTTYKERFSKVKTFVPKSIYDKSFKIEKNDICMALTGENKFDIALAAVYQGETPIAMGGDMTRFRLIYGNPLYFVYAINSTYGINCKQKLATGDIICHISNDKLANIPFPLPPIEEQQRIVEKLNSILPIIDSMAVYGTKKKAGRPKQEEALAFISSLLGTQKSSDSKPISPEILELKAKAKEELPAIVKKYADLMGVSYNRITIRHQKTRWGSCTKTGNLSFNCLLMKMPENVRDYVIIHELAHRKELNHSSKYWAIVAEYCPWYKEAKQWLKDNGQGLMEK